MMNSISAKDIFQSVLIMLLGAAVTVAILNGSWRDRRNDEEAARESASQEGSQSEITEPYTLPIAWGDLGAKMVSVGVIDYEKFVSLYDPASSARNEAERLLAETDIGEVVISEANANVLLNLLWGLGLGNRNPLLASGPMADPRYGGVGNFASTGGWTLSSGSAMNHYSMHPFVTLSPETQIIVERAARNIYRPCCDNSTLMPDCNHGMAMLGLLELMAAKGVSESEMYRAALAVNTFWFPDQYQTINAYIDSREGDTTRPDAKEILGKAYSSGSGYQKIAAMVDSAGRKSSGSCGV